MRSEKFYYTLAFFFYILCTSLYVSNDYQTLKKELLTRIDAQLVSSVKRVILALPKDFHHAQMDKGEVSEEEDRLNIQLLSEYAKLSGVEYLYSFIKQNDKFLFTSSSATDEELEMNENISHYFDVYTGNPVGLQEALSSHKIIFEEATDKWGTFRSVLLPLKSSDGSWYVVGSDLKIDFIQLQLNRVLKKSIFEIIFYLLIMLPIFSAYRIHTRNIKKLLEAKIIRRTRKIKALLDHADQGFLSFSYEMSIHNEYSSKCLEIFEDTIEDHSIESLLYQDDEKKKAWFIKTLRSLINDEDMVRVGNILALMSQEFTFGQKSVFVEFKLVDHAYFMIILTDITAKKILENRREKEKSVLQMVVSSATATEEVSDILREYHTFMEHRLEMVAENNTPEENLNQIYRTVHTFKGVFSQINFITTPKGLYKLETKLSKFLDSSTTTNIQILDVLRKVELENWLERDLSILNRVLGDDFVHKMVHSTEEN